MLSWFKQGLHMKEALFEIDKSMGCYGFTKKFVHHKTVCTRIKTEVVLKMIVARSVCAYDSQYINFNKFVSSDHTISPNLSRDNPHGCRLSQVK
jgi:hypothetical protein